MATKKERLKDPKGGLTAAGRRKYNRETGSNLKAGVRGKADTPEKMRRKGSFLTRFFTNPSGPMVKPNGEPSRLALSAHAWGEPVPKNRSDAARLAEKGRRLLERYEKTKVEKYNPHHDELGRFSSSTGSKVTVVNENSRIVVGKDGIPMMMTTPDSLLAQQHGEQRNWQSIRAIAPSRREKIAKIYESTESQMTPEAKKSWDYTAREIDKQFDLLTNKLGVKVEFVNDDPYPDFFTMANDFRQNRRLKILKTESTGGHPYWSNETNDKFRAVHDAFGHLGTGRGFDRHGEEAAYRAHKSMFGSQAYKCLATELRAQNAYLIQRGHFGDQKIVVLPESLQKGIVPTMISKEEVSIARAKQQSDLDNLTHIGGTHHASNGRNFAQNVSKEDPTSSEVHVDSTNWKAGKPVKRKKKKTISKEEIAKKTKQLKEKTCPDCGEPMSMCKCDMENMSKYNTNHDELGRFSSGGGGKQMRRNAMPRGSFGRAAQLFTRTKLAVAGGIPEAKALKNKGKKKKSKPFDFDQYRLANPGLRVLARPALGKPIKDASTGKVKYPDEMRRNSGTGSFGASMADLGYKERRATSGATRTDRSGRTRTATNPFDSRRGRRIKSKATPKKKKGKRVKLVAENGVLSFREVNPKKSK